MCWTYHCFQRPALSPAVKRKTEFVGEDQPVVLAANLKFRALNASS